MIAALLGIGTAASAVITQTLVGNYLLRQVDDQLAQVVADPASVWYAIGPLGSPSRFFISVRPQSTTSANDDGADHSDNGATAYWPATTQLYGEPDLENGQILGERIPATVPGIGGETPTDWRVVAVTMDPVPEQGAAGRQGFRPRGRQQPPPPPPAPSPPPEPVRVGIGLPLADANRGVAMLARTLAATAAGITALGVAAAYLLVRQSLRPLRQIEATASEIAAGDLTQRVPEAAPATEVGSLGRSLNAMLAQIEVAFAAQAASEARTRRFVSDASHELRTPLTTIRGYAELFRLRKQFSDDDAVPPPGNSHCENLGQGDADLMARIERAAQRMSVLVDDLLALARLDECRSVTLGPVDLAAIAADAANDLAALDPTREVQLTASGPGFDVVVDDAKPAAQLIADGDEARLRQAVGNLVANAARHTPPGTPVEIAIGADGAAGHVVLEMRDHGAGLPESERARIFDRFYRADSSRARTDAEPEGGYGLGLSIVESTITAHGGTTSARQTDANGGLTITLTLPAGAS